MAKIYVASSWRNQYYFRNPPHNHGAFMWKNVDPDFDKWTVNEFLQTF